MRHPNKAPVPQVRSTYLPRPRIMTLLSEVTDFPVIVVKAGAGYGKTTALADYFRQSSLRTCWLTVRGEHQDGVQFIEGLAQALDALSIPLSEWQRIVEAAHSPVTLPWSAQATADVVAAYTHDETVLVIDDFHILDSAPTVLKWVDAWLKRLPADFHVVFATRTNPLLPQVEALSNRGDVLWIRERELAFREIEVGVLFREGAPHQPELLARGQVRWLLQRSAGMAMVLSVLLREWRQHGSFDQLQELLDDKTSIQSQVGRLFVEELSASEREFLRATAIFSTLYPELCDAALGRSDSGDLLNDLERHGHIALSEGGGYTLHPLVRDYLADTLSSAERQHQLQHAVRWHLSKGEEALAIPYLFRMDDEDVLLGVLFSYIPRYLARGQVSTVQGWLDRLPRRVIEDSAGLLFARGEVARHANRFGDALHFYERAHDAAVRTREPRALVQVEMGRARLYLDTIQPGPAIPHIRAARKTVHRRDVETRYGILQLEFENSINLGRISRAKRLAKVLTTFDGAALPGNNSDLRLLLRSGQIGAVIARLKPRVSNDFAGDRSALAHREATLLLALMYAMHGDSEEARQQALRGHDIGYSLKSPFVSAVGYIRLGHAEHLTDPMGDAALAAYQEAVNRMDDMDIPRGKSEAFLGLCLAHGYRGQFALAKAYAEQGIDLAEQVQDLWMASLVRLGLGQCAVVANSYALAVAELSQCEQDFIRVGDPFLLVATLLWRAVARYATGDPAFVSDVDAVLSTAEQHDFGFLLTRATLCGLRDTQMLVPLLRDYLQHGRETRYALQVLDRLGGDAVDRHPGYTLRVQVLGKLCVWRGFREVSRKDWVREKARQLFLFLLTRRGQLLHRDEICEQLWGDVDPDTAERDFKVALNAMASVLEPDRGRGPSVFIVRQGGMYGFTEGPIVSVDAELFETRILEAETTVDEEHRLWLYASALNLYQGDYLTEVRYEPWCEAERDRLRMLFVKTCVSYAQLCQKKQQYEAAVSACNRALESEPTWEDAYVCLMQTYAAQYNRPMVVATYQLCQRTLHREIGVDPLPSTEAVFREVAGLLERGGD
ncbi:hypothetical protein JZ785_17380 [Alicyclobacillus curvatus]|nr:hypothetical protein JZ785_17380 [Alicyclobacillus curvatus]